MLHVRACRRGERRRGPNLGDREAADIRCDENDFVLAKSRKIFLHKAFGLPVGGAAHRENCYFEPFQSVRQPARLLQEAGGSCTRIREPR
jgi:hypothetical protein